MSQKDDCLHFVFVGKNSPPIYKIVKKNTKMVKKHYFAMEGKNMDTGILEQLEENFAEEITLAGNDLGW